MASFYEVLQPAFKFVWVLFISFKEFQPCFQHSGFTLQEDGGAHHRSLERSANLFQGTIGCACPVCSRIIGFNAKLEFGPGKSHQKFIPVRWIEFTNHFTRSQQGFSCLTFLSKNFKENQRGIPGIFGIKHKFGLVVNLTIFWIVFSGEHPQEVRRSCVGRRENQVLLNQSIWAIYDVVCFNLQTIDCWLSRSNCKSCSTQKDQISWRDCGTPLKNWRSCPSGEPLLQKAKGGAERPAEFAIYSNGLHKGIGPGEWAKQGFDSVRP